MRSPVLLFARGELRNRPRSHMALALVVALGFGSAIGALILANSTSRAYPAYVSTAQVNRFALNPATATTDIDAAIRRFVDVASVHTDDLFLAEPVTADTHQSLLGFSSSLAVLGSIDGRYVDVDRPFVTHGRLARGPNEVFVNDQARAALEAATGERLRLGDHLAVSFLPGSAGLITADPSQEVDPLGVERLLVVGFGRLADEVLVDELYPRERIIVSPDVARRYDCVVDINPQMSDEETLAAVLQSGCSTLYRYYSLELDDHTDAVATVSSQFTEAALRLNTEFPSGPVAEQFLAYFLIGEDRGDVDAAVAQTTRPTVAALVVFATLAAFSSLVVAALMMLRLVRPHRTELVSLRALGASRRLLVQMFALPLVMDGMIGLLAAVCVASAVSLIGPVGSVAYLVRPLTLDLPVRIVLPTVAGLAVMLIASAALSSLSISRPTPLGPLAENRYRGLFRLGDWPSASLGIRAAFDTSSGSGVAVLVGAVVAFSVAISSVIFGTSLTRLINDPRDFGWPWDAAVITNGGYGEADPLAIAQSLDGNADVESYSLFGLESATQIAGQPIPSIFGFREAVPPDLAVVEGRMASRPGEAALGSSTANSLGISVGDEVIIQSDLFGAQQGVDVVGIVTLPVVGPLLADHAGLGRGAYVVVDEEPTVSTATFVAIDLVGGAEPAAFFSQLGPSVNSWSPATSSLFTYDHPLRPPAIANVAAMRAAPLILGTVLGSALFVGLVLCISISVRDRRHDLAVLRALGWSSRSLRSLVYWHAGTTTLVGLLVGLPAGLIVGRSAWRLFAEQLGVVPDATLPMPWLVAVILAALFLTYVAGHHPASVAAKLSPAAILRTG